jgi:hypothetical protein
MKPPRINTKWELKFLNKFREKYNKKIIGIKKIIKT